MNPYDFVRIDWDRKPDRRPPLRWDEWRGMAGRLKGTIVAETPLLIRSGNPEQEQDGVFVRNAEGTEVIPGSSLKGLFRSLVETVGNGCWHLFVGSYREYPEQRSSRSLNLTRALPGEFHRCNDPERLCIACRLFGLVGGTVLAGPVSFDEAVCVSKRPHPGGYAPPLMPPKPRHAAWYLSAGSSGGEPEHSGNRERRVAGRKHYFHQSGVTLFPDPGNGYRRKVQPVGPGSEFRFSASFSQIRPQDWPVLMYALVLEDSMRHKLGYAKPAGLGSVRIRLNRLELVDMARRHRNREAPTVYEGEALEQYIEQTIAPIVGDEDNVALQDLRRIWAWPPAPVVYEYPSRDWFSRNPKASIAETKG